MRASTSWWPSRPPRSRTSTSASIPAYWRGRGTRTASRSCPRPSWSSTSSGCTWTRSCSPTATCPTASSSRSSSAVTGRRSALLRRSTPRRPCSRGKRPCVAVCAVRTGCGKAPVARYVARRLRERASHAGAVRHPMPYGNLAQQIVQRFATLEDLDASPLHDRGDGGVRAPRRRGHVVFAGVDYGDILAEAEKEARRNHVGRGQQRLALPPPRPPVALVDPLRPGNELTTRSPGDGTSTQADVVVIATRSTRRSPRTSSRAIEARKADPRPVFLGGRLPRDSPTRASVRGRRVLVVEDGPTVTHGGMAYGAGYLAAAAGRRGAKSWIRARTRPGRDPRGFTGPGRTRTRPPRRWATTSRARGPQADDRRVEVRCRRDRHADRSRALVHVEAVSRARPTSSGRPAPRLCSTPATAPLEGGPAAEGLLRTADLTPRTCDSSSNRARAFQGDPIDRAVSWPTTPSSSTSASPPPARGSRSRPPSRASGARP